MRRKHSVRCCVISSLVNIGSIFSNVLARKTYGTGSPFIQNKRSLLSKDVYAVARSECLFVSRVLTGICRTIVRRGRAHASRERRKQAWVNEKTTGRCTPRHPIPLVARGRTSCREAATCPVRGPEPFVCTRHGPIYSKVTSTARYKVVLLLAFGVVEPSKCVSYCHLILY